MTKLTNEEFQVLTRLQNAVEGNKEFRRDGSVWQETYLGSANPGMNDSAFKATLTSLKARGLYRDLELDFGLVRM